MDDLTRAEQREAEMELVRREMARRSKDIIRVHNPLDFPFRFKWDNYPQSVPAKGYKDMERYLAKVYRKKITEYMIGQQILAKGKELLDLRVKQFGKTFLDKYEENKEVWDRVPKLNDRHLMEEIEEIVIVGLVEEYGMEEVMESEPIRDSSDSDSFDDSSGRMDRKILDEEIV